MTCLPPLIYRIKQKIILNHLYASLNSEILNQIENDEYDGSILKQHQKNYFNNIDEYINEIFNTKASTPFFEFSDSDSSDNESSKEEEIVDDTMINVDQFNKALSHLIKKTKKEQANKRIWVK